MQQNRDIQVFISSILRYMKRKVELLMKWALPKLHHIFELRFVAFAEVYLRPGINPSPCNITTDSIVSTDFTDQELVFAAGEKSEQNLIITHAHQCKQGHGEINPADN